MSGELKRKAKESAERCVPLGIFERAKIVEAFVNGYMTGHAAHTRWANKTIFEYREAMKKRCPHGMPLAENICGPCSMGRPNNPTLS